jgi:hypothetical protein
VKDENDDDDTYIYIYNPSEYQLNTSALKVETVCFSERLAFSNQSTQ